MIENKKLSNSSNYLKKSLAEFFNAWFWNEEGKGKFLTTTKIFKIILKNETEDKRGKRVSIQIPYIQKCKKLHANSLGYSLGELLKVKK